MPNRTVLGKFYHGLVSLHNHSFLLLTYVTYVYRHITFFSLKKGSFMETAFKYFNRFSLCVTLSFMLCLPLFLVDNLFLEHPLAILRDKYLIIISNPVVIAGHTVTATLKYRSILSWINSQNI